MAPSPRLSAEVEAFLDENHLCTFTTLRPDGSPHTAPVRFTWDGDAGLARVMTTVARRKARNLLAAPGSRVSVCQTAGWRWITLEGAAEVSTDPDRVAEGIRRYTKRYWSPPPMPPGLAVVEIRVDRILGG
ncbi:PPOX class F420-dependent oxidoreductase [Streptomyces sp. ISL-36]|uniref:pyridoxamine 5'-phosphate oxidase family protein n=1 Tax=Streptomyces sp. ISL-36 TaxID=2819182 RepID=UPI001BECC7B9|nr:PPOX class F420-dependent oxidoreductase [Streptomyces sp. ISL-36]MBT2444512.1 PPOX class F420-dependent oxidoreductase [Streptomyces sp. ISL-36]